MCPHAPETSCQRRKPLPGLLHRAASEFDLSLADVFVFGDKRSEVELAAVVGATGILVKSGDGANYEFWAGGRPSGMFPFGRRG